MATIIDQSELETAEEDEVLEREVAPGQARKVTESFTEMRAWQQEMRRNPENATDSYYGSRKKFMENCRTIYPVEVIDARQAGSEIVAARQDLESLDQIPNLLQELAKKARDIRAEQTSDPIELIREIDKIVEPASRMIQQYIEQYPGTDFEAGSQLDRCFREIYRLEILRDVLESSLTDTQKAELAAGKEKSEKAESPEAYRVRIEDEVEASWDRLLREQFGMSLDAWFAANMPRDPDWTMFGSDTAKWERLHTGMQELKRDYLDDPRMHQEKDFDFKVRLNEILSGI
ncbi:MAG: hypothetical protein HW405_971 [Candidatus Berkelbacteria bacterium]|nr:hypothetical protein [Candidatus Berkelbacteria bacterium]